MILSAATEGLGLVLLVPMLGALETRAGSSAGHISKAFNRLGIPLTLTAMLAMFVVLIVFRVVISHARGLASQRFQANIVDGLRRRAWSALLHCDWRVLAGMRNSDNASQLLTNIDRVGVGVDQAVAATTIAITLGGIGVAALAISPEISAGAISGGVLVLLAYRGVRRRASGLGEHLSEAYARVYGQLQEGLEALRVIKGLSREAKAEEDVMAEFAALRRAEMAFRRDIGLAQIALQGSGALVLASIVWWAETGWHAGPAAILPMVALFARALPLLGDLQEAWQSWAHARPALGGTLALIEQAESAREPDVAMTRAPIMRKSIALEQVTVRFKGRAGPVLNGVNLSIPAHGIVAVTGPSGAGKSTLADLLSGLVSPDEGTISVDGVALRDGAGRAWRSQVAYVQQEPVLFTGNIRENLLWGAPEASEERLWQVLDNASALFVRQLPDGLDTLIGESGRQLSGGERQRIVLARHLLRDPSLIILDEATSAIDIANEAAIISALERLRDRLAIVVICHRGALTEIADRVVDMEAGRIVSDKEKCIAA